MLKKTLKLWLYAVKINSWPKLLVPCLLGQFLAGRTLPFSWPGFLLGFAFTICLVIYIVLLNDWADQSVDTIKRRMFPTGCSPKTIPDHILPARQVLWVGLMSGGLAVSMALAGSLIWQRVNLFLFGLVCLGIFAVYSLPPFRLNYRGGGELLEMLGVGLALPVFNLYAQSGLWWTNLATMILPGYTLLCLAGAVASGLSDEQSDHVGGKTTLVTQIGNARARLIIEALCLSAGLLWLVLPFVLKLTIAIGPMFIAVFVLAFQFGRMLTQSGAAVTNAFSAQTLYKQSLHRGAWWGVLSYVILAQIMLF